MEKNLGSSSLSPARRKRIKIMRSCIVFGIPLAILALLIICIYLLMKVSSLEEQLDMLYNSTQKSEYEVPKPKAKANVGDSDEDKIERSISDSAVLSGNKVYLTFDDGPSGNTERILDILDRYDVKATFFVVGKSDDVSIKGYKEIVKRGHTLGMHSYTHQYSQIYNSKEDFVNDFHKIQDYLYELTGVKSVFYRFPGGSSNQVSRVDIKKLIKFLKKEGITYFDWNDSCGDATSENYSADVLADNVIENINTDRDTYVLMHDANDKDATVDSLPKILDYLKSIDANVAAIDENSVPYQHISISD